MFRPSPKATKLIARGETPGKPPRRALPEGEQQPLTRYDWNAGDPACKAGSPDVTVFSTFRVESSPRTSQPNQTTLSTGVLHKKSRVNAAQIASLLAPDAARKSFIIREQDIHRTMEFMPI